MREEETAKKELSPEKCGKSVAESVAATKECKGKDKKTCNAKRKKKAKKKG